MKHTRSQVFEQKKRHSLDSGALGLGAVSREDSVASVGGTSESGGTAASLASTQEAMNSAHEVKKLRERMKIVEEALRAMRDEAREHVLAIKSSDIVLTSLLGSGRSISISRYLYICMYVYIYIACIHVYIYIYI